MTPLEVVALICVTVWMGVLTVAVLLLVRQLGIVTVRLDRMRGDAPVADGIDVGVPAPTSVIAEVIGPVADPAYFVILAASCTPCRELADELRPLTRLPNTAFVISGREELSLGVVQLLGEGYRAIAGAAAEAMTHDLQIQTSPFVFEITDGQVTGKAVLRNARELFLFVGSEYPPGDQKTLHLMEVGA